MHYPPPPSVHSPRPRDLVVVFIVAVSLRIILCLATMWLDESSFSRFVESIDGTHFLSYAQAWLGEVSSLDAYHGRLFPGYPGLIALLHFAGVPLHAAAVVPNWLATGAIAVFSALLFGDRRIGWAAAVVTPSFLLNSVLVSTEPWCLMLSLIGLVAVVRGHHVAGGAVFGLAGFVRPMACFALLAFIFVRWSQRRWRQGLLCGVTAAVVFAGGMGLVARRFGDPLMSVRGYQYEKAHGERMFSWPFESLLMTPARQAAAHADDPAAAKPVAKWKLVFVCGHVVIVVIGCALAAYRWLRAREPLTDELPLLALIWLGLNTLFVVCIGSDWGFHSFDRFILLALPPLLYSYQRVLPRRPKVWLVIGALSLGLALEATAKQSIPQRLKQLTRSAPADEPASEPAPEAPAADSP